MTRRPATRDPLEVLRKHPIAAPDRALERARETRLKNRQIAERDGAANSDEWIQRKIAEFSRRGRTI